MPASNPSDRDRLIRNTASNSPNMPDLKGLDNSTDVLIPVQLFQESV